MAKYYFGGHNDESCYSLQYHLEYMAENGIEEMIVFEAKIERGSGYFFCKHFFETGETREICGKLCELYKPRNGKSGICRHYGYVYEQTDKSKLLKRIL